MGKIRKNEAGFSAVELLIILVVVALIGGAGYFVYKSHHKVTTASVATTTTSKPTTTTPPASTTTPTTTSSGYLVIKEWGVRIKPALSLPSVTYAIDSSESYQQAKLTFKDLPDSCSGFYHFNRAKAGQDIDGYGTTPERYQSIDQTTVKKVGDYYFYLGHGQAACSPDSSVTDKQNTLVEQITGTPINANNYSIEAIPASQ